MTRVSQFLRTCGATTLALMLWAGTGDAAAPPGAVPPSGPADGIRTIGTAAALPGSSDASPTTSPLVHSARFALTGAPGLLSGGDVLRPGRRAVTTSDGWPVWHVGLDAGVTWSRFGDGPLAYYVPNPYFPASQVTNYRDFALGAVVRDGSGLGFVVGGTVDVGFNPWIGLQLKANYHTRTGEFEESTDYQYIHPDTQTGQSLILRDNTAWTFSYIGVDLLARVQVIPQSLYVLLGPSIGLLNGNEASLNQRIIQPDDIFYEEAVYESFPTERELKTASSSHEVDGFESSRIDLKAGLGMWIPLTGSLSLTPELTVAIPLTGFVKSSFNNPPVYVRDVDAKVHPFVNPDGFVLEQSDNDFNMLTVMFTLGLRWRI